MPTVFTRIIDGELPGVFVGGTRMRGVPLDQPDASRPHARRARAEVDHWIDLEPELAAHLFRVAQTIGQAQEAALDARRIGV